MHMTRIREDSRNIREREEKSENIIKITHTNFYKLLSIKYIYGERFTNLSAPIMGST